MGFIDLHCHWIPGVDDGAPTFDASLAMLRGLGGLGFSLVIATPHMRPGLFDNDAAALRAAFDAVEQRLAALPEVSELPERALSSEHFFDEQVFRRVSEGRGLPYPGEDADFCFFFQHCGLILGWKSEKRNFEVAPGSLQYLRLFPAPG